MGDTVEALRAEVATLRRAESALRASSRALAVLSRCNHALVSATSEAQLLDSVCDTLASDGGYRLAWIGFAEHGPDKSIRPVGMRGFDEGYLEALNLTWADTERGQGPSATAIRTGRSVVARNIHTDPNFAPWRGAATDRGFASSIAIPLVYQTHTLGAVSIYSVEPDAFDKEEERLLSELARNLTYGIENLRSKRAAEDAQMQLNMISEAAKDGIVVVDSKGCITHWNRAATQMLGYSREEVLGRNLHAFLAPSRFEVQDEEMFPQSKKTGQSQVMGRTRELSALKKSGEELPIELSLSCTQLQGSWHAVGIVRDITTRKKSEGVRQRAMYQLGERIKELEALSDVAKVSSSATDIPTLLNQITELLPSAMQYPASARARSRYAGQVYLSAPFEPTDWSLGANIKVAGKVAGTMEVFYLKDPEGRAQGLFSNEERALLQVIARLVSVSIGRLVSLQQLQNREETLREYKMAVEQSADGIAMSDLSGNIHFVNGAWARMHGYATDEVVGRQLSGFHTEEQRHKEVGPFNEQMNIAGSNQGELGHLHRDGTAFPTWTTRTLLTSEANDALGVLDVVRDITARRQLETELSHARKLEAAGQLAAGIAHEINTPTQFVSDSLYFLKEAFEDQRPLLRKYQEVLASLEGDPKFKARLDEVHEAEEDADLEYLEAHVPASFERCVEGLTRISTIVGAMKEFAHPDQREQSPADINQALRSTLVIARNEYKYVANIETDLGTLPQVVCYVGDLNQVFLNLLVNAAHAIADVVGDSGDLGLITVKTMHENEWVRIEIGDTGSGIPKEDRDRVFDPFFTTKEVGKGSGQGLAIAHSVVTDKHRGALSFETKIGEGTTFIVRVPVMGSATAGVKQ